MIEQGIYFALGCIVTALLALLFAPVFWSRALRLTRKRLQLQVPLSMQEILAERDGLRATFAVERLRIEQEMERVRATKARDMAEIGRRTVEAATAAEEVSALRRLEQAQEREIGLLMREVAETGAASGALQSALDRAHDEVERMKQEAETAAASSASAAEEVEKHRTASVEVEGLRGRLEAAMAQAARHEVANISLGRDLEAARRHVRELEDRAGALEGQRDAAVSEGREREKSLYLQNSMKAERARGSDRAATEKLDMLQAENAVLRGALDAARRDPDAAKDDAGDGGLRSSIHALGLAVALMTREARETTAVPAAPAPGLPVAVDAD